MPAPYPAEFGKPSWATDQVWQQAQDWAQLHYLEAAPFTPAFGEWQTNNEEIAQFEGPQRFIYAAITYALNATNFDETMPRGDLFPGIAGVVATIFFPGVSDALEVWDAGGGLSDIGAAFLEIARLTDNGAGTISDMGRDVLRAIVAANASATGSVRDTGNAAILGINDTWRTSSDRLFNLTDAILNSITGANDNALQQMLYSFGRSANSIESLAGRGSDVLSVITDKALEAIGKVLGNASDHESQVVEILGAILGRHLDSATENSTTITRAISRQIDAEMAQSQRNAEVISRGIERSLEDITGVANGALSSVGQAIIREGGAAAEATTQAAEGLRGSVHEGFAGLSKVIARLTGDGDAPTPQETSDRIDKAFKAVSAQGNCPADFTEFVHDFMNKILGNWHPATPLAMIFADLGLLQQLSAPAIQVMANCLAQTAARAMPTALNSPPELQDQMRRGLVTKAEAMSDLLSQGFTPEKADRVLAARQTNPDVGIIQTWYLRGMINPKQAFDALAKLGFDADDSQGLLEMAYFIPPPADLVTMAVREAFSPQVAKRFGQYEDFPEDFAKYAAQQGISRQWAERYWAAHWSLPSPQQGFEMLQRDVIKTDDLNLLLKALDVMPFWRDKLTQIAFRPVTRVDIRRMHALKLLDHDGMVKRYRHMGYSPDDAAFMAKFTERLNAPKGEHDVEELEGATKATVLTLFRRGVITEADARKILEEMGAGDRAINVLLTNERTKLELERRDDEEALLIEQASAGVISVDEARDKLGAIGLTATEFARASAKLSRVEARQTKLPTRGEAEKMFTNDVINELEYLAVLRKLGYSVFWSAKFLQLARKLEKAP